MVSISCITLLSTSFSFRVSTFCKSCAERLSCRVHIILSFPLSHSIEKHLGCWHVHVEQNRSYIKDVPHMDHFPFQILLTVLHNIHETYCTAHKCRFNRLRRAAAGGRALAAAYFFLLYICINI